jgi:glutaredoxin 3|tara:strand:- start:68 stop:310 length:243 start_codon:yes stop_codon:yes gene_type:complete
MRAVVWSKNNCAICDRAKAYLDSKEIAYEERNIEGPDWTPSDFFEAVPNARTFPQIEIDGKMIGGYEMMMTHISLGDLSL